MSFGIIRPIQQMGPRPVVNREREYPRVQVVEGGITAATLGSATTDVDGLAALSFTPPRGDVLTLYVIAATQTSGTLVVPGFASAPGTPAGAFLSLTVPGGTSTLNVYSYAAGGTPVSSRTIGLQGFAA